MSYRYFLPIFAAVLLLPGCSKQNDDIFDNQVYIDQQSVDRKSELSISIFDTYTETLTAAVPKQAEEDITVEFAADKKMVAEYNQIYGENAKMLPFDNYYFDDTKTTISKGSVASSPVTINFEGILDLDKEIVYVLPVVIKSSTVDVLAKRSVKYYVFRGAGVVSVVADISGGGTGNFVKVTWNNTSVIQNLTGVTYEALAYAEFTNDGSAKNNGKNHTNGDGIFSLMGVETSSILIRRWAYSTSLGHDNDVEICGLGVKNTPDMPNGRWFHYAITYDKKSGTFCVYIDGQQVYTQNLGSKSFTVWTGTGTYPDFHIGKSYNNSRWWPGCVSEVRIWNRALTADELSDSVHPYYVDPQSDGLIAYWKFNEGNGTKITDQTGNGNNGEAEKAITWVKKDLPE